jgi:uncharacterized protein (DUF1697 family)
MTKYIAILRGINVGGKRKILMADLKQLFIELGFSDVSTYIQSGNVLFSTEKQEEEDQLAGKLEQSIYESFGFEVAVIIRNSYEVEKTIAGNPFLSQSNAEIEHLHLTFLKDIPATNNLTEINRLDFSPDRFQVIGKDAYIYCSAKYSDTKLTNQFFEKKLKVSATTRNWKTVIKLAELSKQ